MPTASVTPNLGLMSPVSSDAFTPDDYAATFAKLDAVPGAQVVANQASRPTGFSAAQHGRMVWQADLNVMWIWTQPSALVAGAWARLGGYGLLGSALNPTQVNSTSLSWTTAPVAVSVNVMVPGGRPCLVLYGWEFIANDSSRQITVDLVENSTAVLERRHTGSSFGIAADLPPDAKSYWWVRTSAATQQQINFQLRIRVLDPAVVGPDQGGGTSSIWSPMLAVFEL